MSDTGQTPIDGPEPWSTTQETVWSHWDPRFCPVARADHDGDLEKLTAIENGGRLSGAGTAEATRGSASAPFACAFASPSTVTPRVTGFETVAAPRGGLARSYAHPPTRHVRDRVSAGRRPLCVIRPPDGMSPGLRRAAPRSRSRTDA
jgi:hypothetical protein